jgi:hypothetical protein
LVSHNPIENWENDMSKVRYEDENDMILGNIDDILEGSQPCPKLWRLELTK